MADPDQKQYDDFEVEVRERLTRLEATQEALVESIDDMTDQNTELLEAVHTVDEHLVSESWMYEAQQERERNTQFRHQLVGIAKLVAFMLSILVGSGVIVLLL